MSETAYGLPTHTGQQFKKYFCSKSLLDTSIFTLSGKVPKFQNDVLHGTMYTDVSPYILKFKLFFKNTCFTMAAWIHVGLLQSKSKMIYLPGKVRLIVIHINQTDILQMSCGHKHQQQSYHNENTKICIFIHHIHIDMLFPLTKVIPTMSERVTTYQQIQKTWIRHNETRLMMITQMEREPEPINFGHLHQNYYLTG